MDVAISNNSSPKERLIKWLKAMGARASLDVNSVKIERAQAERQRQAEEKARYDLAEEKANRGREKNGVYAYLFMEPSVDPMTIRMMNEREHAHKTWAIARERVNMLTGSARAWTKTQDELSRMTPRDRMRYSKEVQALKTKLRLQEEAAAKARWEKEQMENARAKAEEEAAEAARVAAQARGESPLFEATSLESERAAVRLREEQDRLAEKHLQEVAERMKKKNEER
jgi:hypothetical protein